MTDERLKEIERCEELYNDDGCEWGKMIQEAVAEVGRLRGAILKASKTEYDECKWHDLMELLEDVSEEIYGPKS